MDQVLTRCNENKSQYMVSFLARMADCWDSMPDEFVPFWDHWSKDPTFDAKGHPFLKVIAPTMQEREIIAAKLHRPENRWRPSWSAINHYWIRTQMNLEPKIEIKAETEETSSETKAQKFVVPIVYNATYGGYGFNRQMLDLLNKSGVYECMGFERPEHERGPKTQKDILEQSKDESFGMFKGSYDLCRKLPRHHFLLTCSMVILGSAQSSMITELATDFVPFRCADFYRIHEYDGSESVIAEPGRAIACKAVELSKAADVDTRSLVSDLRLLIQDLEYNPLAQEEDD